MLACRRRYGPTFTIRLPPHPLVFVCERSVIKQIFTAKGDEMHAGEVNSIIRVLVGDSSVLLLDGPEHMRQRRLMLPSFHGERMRLYGETMQEITERVVNGWPSAKPFSMHPHMQHITLEVILRTVFGVDEGSQLTELRDQLKALLGKSELPVSTLLTFYLSKHPELATRKPWKWVLAERDRTDTLVYKQIAARRQDPHAAERTDVLAMLMQARDEEGLAMTDAELRDELITALAAGHETTATALCWAFERLLTHPEVYERLEREIDGACENGALRPDKVAQLEYLDAVVKEVLRLRPILPLVGRVLQKPTSIAGFDLPAGAVVAPCIYLTQREPELYPEPEKFMPERFLGVQPDPYSWLPFGGGIRRCLGAAFALYEMKVVIGTVLARARLNIAQRTPVRVVRRAITFSPESGMRVVAEQRA
jgi:cytochrome P450